MSSSLKGTLEKVQGFLQRKPTNDVNTPQFSRQSRYRNQGQAVAGERESQPSSGEEQNLDIPADKDMRAFHTIDLQAKRDTLSSSCINTMYLRKY